MRLAGQVAGFTSLFFGVLNIVAVVRMLWHPAAERKDGTFGYFLIFLLSSVGDSLIAFGLGPLSLALPVPNASSSSSLPPSSSELFSWCSLQGGVVGFGASSSVIFSALLALEMYFIRPRFDSMDQHYFDSHKSLWKERSIKMSAIGLMLTALQVTLTQCIYGYGNDHPHLTPWCWIRVNTAVSRTVSQYFVLYTSTIVILVAFFKYLRHINARLSLAKMPPTRLRRKLRCTFMKLAIYPLIYVLFWSPAVVSRFLVFTGMKLTPLEDMNMLIIHAVLIAGLGTMNFLLLGLCNHKVRSHMPFRTIIQRLGDLCCSCFKGFQASIDNETLSTPYDHGPTTGVEDIDLDYAADYEMIPDSEEAGE